MAEEDDEILLLEKFEKVEEEIMGKGEHERLLKLADRMANAIGERV